MLTDDPLRQELTTVLELFFAGDLDRGAYDQNSPALRFISMLERYAAPKNLRSRETPFRWHGLPVVSTLIPPVGSALEKRFLVDLFLARFHRDCLAQFSIIIAPSYHCRAHCEQCYVAAYVDPDREELSVDQLGRIFEKIIGAGVWHIDISGGEPLENPKFFDIVEQLPMDKATAIIATNGFLLDQGTIDRIKRSNIMALKISLESPAKMVRNAGSDGAFNEAVEGIKRVIDNNIYAFVQAFVERDCWRDDELEKRILLCRDTGVTRINVVTPLAVGRMKDRTDCFLATKDREYIYFLQEKYARNKEGKLYITVFPDDGAIGRGCPAARGRIYVNPYGDVFPCNFLPEKCYGNIVTGDFRQMVKAMRRDLADQPKHCRASNIDLDGINRLKDQVAQQQIDPDGVLDMELFAGG